MRNVRLAIFATLALVSFIASARTVEIKMSQCPKPLAVSINNVTKSLGVSDTVILNFDKKGNYEFDRTVRARCNVVMKGLGEKKTKIVLTEGVDSKGKMLFSNDCYFYYEYPKNGNLGWVSIHDLAVEMTKHSKLWWNGKTMHLFKITHANKVDVTRTKTSLHNAVITNFDLRSCSNVTVENNEIINYNYSEGGGCVWSRDNQRNVVIRNNVFRKYGKDEVIAAWGTEKTGSYVIENLDISNNTIYYGNYQGGSTSNSATMLMSLCHFRGDYVHDSHFKISNVNVAGNNIYLDYSMRFMMLIKFDDLVTHSNIKLCGNTIHKSRDCTKSMTREIVDFMVEDGSAGNNSILIKDNTSTCAHIDHDKHTLNSNVFISMTQGKVEATGNELDCENRGQFFYISDKDATLTMNDNQATGLYVLGTVKGCNSAAINAHGNELSGDTRIYCNNAKALDLNFTGNTFNSSNYHFFLQEAALNTSLTFEDNTINALEGKGTIYANYTGKAYNFKKVSVTGNVFKGVARKDVENTLVKASNKRINNNVYR